MVGFEPAEKGEPAAGICATGRLIAQQGTKILHA
jgi:hypothetical protein